jgi:hypothetical protein
MPQHGGPGGNSRLTRQGQNLSGAHEAFLLDELTGSVGRQAGRLERLDERSRSSCFTAAHRL